MYIFMVMRTELKYFMECEKERKWRLCSVGFWMEKRVLSPRLICPTINGIFVDTTSTVLILIWLLYMNFSSSFSLNKVGCLNLVILLMRENSNLIQPPNII